jgi:hypothetical protein
VKLFQVVLSTQRTDFVVTNEQAQDDTQAVQEVCGLRWKIEQLSLAGLYCTRHSRVV